MLRPEYSDSWPESWQRAYRSEQVEFWGSRVDLAYTYSYRRRFRETLRQVQQYLPSGSTIIDVAAGKGSFTLALADIGYRVTWNDLRDDLEGYVRLRDDSGRVSYRPGNALDLEGADPFDAVLANEVIEHVAHPDQLLAGLRDQCRAGGWIFLSTPHGGYFRNQLPNFSDVDDLVALESQQFQPGADGHLFLFTNDELVQLAAGAGLEVVEVSNFTSPVLIGKIGVRGALRVLPASLVRAGNAVAERASKRLLMNTAVVLRRP